LINYSNVTLCTKLEKAYWTREVDNVQGFWNSFKNKITNVVDVIVSISKFENNTTDYSQHETKSEFEETITLEA
jgi:hypothetical protein